MISFSLYSFVAPSNKKQKKRNDKELIRWPHSRITISFSPCRECEPACAPRISSLYFFVGGVQRHACVGTKFLGYANRWATSQRNIAAAAFMSLVRDRGTRTECHQWMSPGQDSNAANKSLLSFTFFLMAFVRCGPIKKKNKRCRDLCFVGTHGVDHEMVTASAAATRSHRVNISHKTISFLL